MIEKLTKYTQTKNIASVDITTTDVVTPFTFREWLERNIGILPGKERVQYELYLKKWYKDKSIDVPTSESIKEDYIQLIKQLTLAFKSESDAVWASDINFDDPSEVTQVIPFYATKLKEIAIYLINKREAIKRAKLKYNMSGSFNAIERLFYEYLLKAFSKKQFPGNEYITNVTDVSVFNAIPELSAVNANFQILLEELYDDASYFDRDPSLPASAYFTFNSNVTTYLDSLGITADEYEWLYTTGVTNLCADNPLIWSIDNVLNQYKNGVPLSAVELNDSDVLNEYNRIKLSQKYLGEEQYILSGGYWVPWTAEFNLNLNTGNNWFYWPSGENVHENDTNIIIDPIPLASSNLKNSGATAGVKPENSDIIFFQRDNGLSGYWLRSIEQTSFVSTMSAKINNSRTQFAFPYPGYGLSGEDLEWTGRSTNNLDQTFVYLEDDIKKSIYNAYWNAAVPSISSINPLYINDATLIESGAKAAEKFSEADYIIKRPTFNDQSKDGVYNGNQEYAWLYKMVKTDLPISTGKNNLYWPFERYNESIQLFASANQCAPLSLINIDMSNFIGAVAGPSLDISDRIYKKPSANSSVYTEGAWLSGRTLNLQNITDTSLLSGTYQPNMSFRAVGGGIGTFIWTDSKTQADTVFNNKQHQKDCPYLKNQQFSLYKENPSYEKNLNYNQWQTCSCRSVIYSPLGHPGSVFDDYNGIADFIIALTKPMSSFSFNDWRGIDGQNYLNSNEFGWFKLNNQYSIEPDVGWGSGNWVTNNGSSFMLSSNITYLYYRNGMRRDSPESNVPYIIVKHASSNANNNSKWIKMVYDKNISQWINTGAPSDMVIKPGDILMYDHRDTFSFTLTSKSYIFTEQETSIMPDMTNYSVSALLSPLNLPSQTLEFPVDGITDGPLDSAEVYTLCSVPVEYLTEPFGPIPVSASITNLNPVSLTTVLSTITTEKINYYTYTSDAINYILSVNLYGWNYNTNKYDGVSLGARPFWVEASDGDNDYTKRKSVDIWSGSPVVIDEYNYITQPTFSNITLEENTYIEYVKRDSGVFIWVQPFYGMINKPEIKWCKLDINTNAISNLSSVLYNNIDDLIVSATYIPATINFDVIKDKPLLINYFARNDFTWSELISNSSLGLPPTGGVWVPIKTEMIITPSTPYANLSNRHYPTYASVPSIGELYSTKDSGGYFTPKYLGVTTAISKKRANYIDTSGLNNDPSKRGVTAIYRDQNKFLTDRGLSNKDQIVPVSTESVDSRWMKASISEGQKAGMIVNAREHQEFSPIQTKYESINSNTQGLFRQKTDAFDPWFGEFDTTWENETDWPANWRKQYDIAEWYKQSSIVNQHVYQWKTDIFGNEYGLLKSNNILNESIYNKKHSFGGTLWTRNARNIISPATNSLTNVFGKYTNSLSANILDFDLWYDTMMIYTSSDLYIFKLNFDYDTGIISSTSDETSRITMNDSKFGGTWLFEDDKKVTICTLLSCGDQIRPILRSLNLETTEITHIYDKDSTYTNMSSIALTSYDHPTFTYDYYAKLYNISYIGYNNIKSGMYFTSININNIGETYNIVNLKTIIPEA